MTTTSAHTKPPALLSDLEQQAWKGFLRTHALVTKALDAEIETEHRLSLSSYEVLLHLAMTDHGRMRMSELAESVILSRSGLTRLIDRLERDGLIERCACPQDARGFFACLTDDGRALFDAARASHLAAVQRRFTGLLDPDQLAVLATVWDRVRGSAADDAPGCAGT